MYTLKNLNWLPKPHSLSFVNAFLKDYKYTSTIIFAIKEDKILLVNVKSRGWDFVGGRIEDNENILDCAKREFLEETGYISNNLEFIGSHKIDCHSNPKGPKTAQAIYIAHNSSMQSKELEEDIIECQWLSMDDILKLNFSSWKIDLINYIKNILNHKN